MLAPIYDGEEYKADNGYLTTHLLSICWIRFLLLIINQTQLSENIHFLNALQRFHLSINLECEL